MPASGTLESNIAAAAELYNARRYAEAEAALHAITAQWPDAPMPWMMLGLAAAQQGRPFERLAYLRKAVDAAPADHAQRATLAQLYIAAGHTAEGIAQARRVLQDTAGDTDLRTALASALMTHGDIAGSRALTARLRTDMPDHFNAALSLAQLDALLGDDAAARDHITAAQRLKPTSKLARGWAEDLAFLAALRAWRHTVTPPRTPMSDNADWVATLTTALAPLAGSQPLVVFYHVAQTVPHPFQTLQQGAAIDYFEIMGLAATAAHRAMPASRVVVVTDPDTVIPAHADIDAVVRLPVQRDWLMYERMRTQRAVAATGLFTGPLVFIDTDIILNRDFTLIFDQGFDAAVTWRPHPLMPINGGMILGRPGPGLLRFFDANIAWYETLAAQADVKARYPFDARCFRGGQLAHAAYVNWECPMERPATGQSGRKTIDGADVAFFPAEDLNFTYTGETDPAALDAKYAVHFKGGPAKAFVTRLKL